MASLLRRLPVSLGPRSYEIAIGRGNLGRLGQELKAIDSGLKQMIVTSNTVWSLYGKIVSDSLESNGFDVSVTIVRDGEEAKSFQSLLTIFDMLLENEFERRSGIVALGGGVVGDLAGFAAATFMRGIRYVQVPTTLLAQVDSSIGGKTGINHPRAKNVVGAFYQPRLVWADASTLSTLPEREIRSGLAEVIKYAVISDPALCRLLPENASDLLNASNETLIEVIYRCCSIKAHIVERDEKEQHDLRPTLNYGHTIGHALESLTNYVEYTHGEAVAIGMMGAAQISLEIGTTNRDMVHAQEDMIRSVGLPTTTSHPINSEELTRQLQKDKKRLGGRVRWVLPRKLGEVFLTEDVPESVVQRVVNDLTHPKGIEVNCT
jgi:3-dehydroquinate synthase